MINIAKYPLTLPQQSFYYDYLLHGDGCKYNMGGVLVVNGNLDLNLFRKAYDYAVSKFDSFRIRIFTNDGEAFQTILKEENIPVGFLDLRNTIDPFEEAMKYVEEEKSKPFVFENSCLHSEMILQTGDKQFIWFIKFHHIIDDGYGRFIFNATVSNIYNSLLEDGSYPEIKEYSYKDFIEDDLIYQKSNAFSESLEFWKRKFSILPEPLDFSARKYCLKKQLLHNERITLNLHRICYASLLKIADESEVSSFQAVLGLFYITLYKLYGQSDIIIGMPVLNRSNHKFKSMPGLFMNMVPLRLKIDSAWSFSEILNEIKLEVKEIYRHQRFPLKEIIRHLRSNKDFKNELFDVSIDYRKMDFSKKIGESKFNAITLDTQLRTESLSLEIDEYDDEGNVNLFFNYNPQVISEQEMIQFAKSFESVLFELIYYPEKKISNVSVLSTFERHKILNSFNAIGKAKKTDKNIVSMFSVISSRFCEKIAIIENEKHTKYVELDKRSNQIANYLINKAKINKGDIICFCNDRSTDAIIAMMGIMKSGAVYMPVDHSIPSERLNYILANSGAKCILTDKQNLKKLFDNVILLEDAFDEDYHDASVAIDGHDLAYVIYTSGSTGLPKGVMIEHGSFMNMFVNQIDGFGVTDNDRVLQFASLGFDASVFEIFQALLKGATLVIADNLTIQDPTSFIRYMNDKKVTVATIPPVYLNALEKPELPYLHTLITAGEQPVLSDVNYFNKDKRYINAYGPTEASVCATSFRAEKDVEYNNCLPIGKSVSGSIIYILNNNLEPVPIGFAGEICISGLNLARGYLNNPELTSQKFIENPFEVNQRLYRTGDKAKFLPDGNIEFLGRLDQQVKIKGNRIELGEIENRLIKHPKIIDSVVLVFENSGISNLAAFIKVTSKPEIKEIKKFLIDFLPEYMVPHHILIVDRIPLTSNGKINTEELVNMVSSQPVKKDELDSSPSTELELELTKIFEKVLDCSNIGVNDNFFELGGESLKTARLISHIKKNLQHEVSFKTIFDNPTVRGISNELVKGEIGDYAEILPTPLMDYYPLSHAQKRLWILAQDKPNAAVYNMPIALQLDGEVNLEYIKQAIHVIVTRHESLRTSYLEIEGTPYQKINKTFSKIISEIDFRKDNNAATKADFFINKEVMLPFNLSNTIPFRANIIRITDDKTILLLMIHHIAGDGISIGILMKELAEIYNSLTFGSSYDYKLNLIDYKDYSCLEEKLLDTEKYKKEKEYWLKTLYSPIPVLDLPTDNMRPAIKSYNGKYYFSEIGKSLTSQLKKYGYDHNSSPFMVLLACVNVLLHKYTSENDIIIGTPVSGRNIHELEKQVGLYINTLAIRNVVDASMTFNQFMQSVRLKSLDAFSNSNYPFDCLIEDLTLERDTSRAPLFDVMLQYQNDDVTKLNLENITTSPYKIDFTTSKFDFTYTFTDNDGKIDLCIGYNVDIFEKERIEKSVVHLLNILNCVLSNPNTRICDICLLDNTEKLQINKMSEGPIARTEDKTIVDLFEDQVLKTPDQIAVVFNDISISYLQLDEKANAVANHILSLMRIIPDDIIAVMAPRSELFLIGILGVLKAGAAYLPIGPDLPDERVIYMLKESKCKLLLTETGMLERISKSHEIQALDIQVLSTSDIKKPEIDLTAKNLAYVIYTSGSTGSPKGVMIEHHSVVNLVSGLADGIYHSDKRKKIALISPFVFDASVKQIFYALLNGHCLDIVPDDIRMNGRKLLIYYKNHLIDVTDGTPQLLDIILDELVPGKETYLPQRFVIGGQQLMYSSIKKIFDITGNNKPVISNVYGPTECCDVSTIFNINSDLIHGSEKVFISTPIGKPINNVRVLILDSNLVQVPPGVDGELYISGEGLARGYMNRADLTAEKFINLPILPNQRLYKTGDIGRYLYNGNILLNGRSDDQIKLRGFRIELSEIESCIRNYDRVVSVAVLVVGENNDQEIAAYYTAKENIDKSDLHNYLSHQLPVYMIPSHLVEVEKIPLTVNGKVDKRALPDPIIYNSDNENLDFSGDLLKERLLKIWKELLHTDKIGINDNFFKLGGHSLIAIRLVSRVHKEFNVEINIWEVFQNPTVSSLAELIKSKNPSMFTHIEKIDEKEYYPLSHSQRRLWLLSKLEGQNAVYNLPSAFHVKGDLNLEALKQSFQWIFQRHESFRTYFIEIDGEPFQKIADSIDFEIEFSDYEGDLWDENTLKAIAEHFFEKEFNLFKLPLIEVKLIRMSGNDLLFLINMHHIIADGWSIEVMLNELEANYKFCLNNLDYNQEPLRIQYKDYALWQNKLIENETLNSSKEFWHNKLKGPRPLLSLPTDFDRNKTYSIEGELIRMPIDKNTSMALTELANSRDSSLFMTLLSIVYILIYKYTGEEDLLVGSPVAGRQHNDLENQVGFFINTIVLRNKVNPNYTFLEFLSEVNQSLSEAFDNQSYPFDKLVDELDVERIINKNPLFDVMVAWMVKNGMSMNIDFEGVEVKGLEFNITKSMFDLSFNFEEKDGIIIYGIEYNTSLFRRETILRMSEHLNTLIENILINPSQKISNIEIISSAEKERLLYYHNNQDNASSFCYNVIEKFREKAIECKNDIALVYNEKEITYTLLDSLSDKIANHLISKSGIAKEDVVAVNITDPIKSVVSLLAVLKAGAVYLPILADLPSERVAFMLNDSKAKIVLVDSNSSDYLNQININEAIIEETIFPKVIISPNDLAYILYTSGSTGTPNGVMIEHKSLTNLIESISRQVYSNYSEPLNELMISSFGFDVSLKQIFATLCNGKTLHLLDNEKKLDPREIIKYIIDRKINIADLTPSLFSVMLEEGFSNYDKPDLKEIYIGSEALPFKLIKDFWRNPKNRNIKMTNFYGPTECCVESSSFSFAYDQINMDYDIAPIGKPILNEQIYILDEFLNLSPIGVTGEICIAGKGLARQYLNNPEKTNEKFVNIPIIKGQRIYKTGDLGRIMPDGNIEFLGRKDDQVKIRGFRIELQEIEKRIREIDNIIACTVTLIESGGSSDLAAFFTSKTEIDISMCRNHLEQFLPKYMVPTYFTRVNSIPLSSNGKVNKKLLPNPSCEKINKKSREPEDEIESVVVKICSKVLKKDKVSIEDNFFEIGGNSLNAVRLISQIQKQLDINLNLKEIFYNPVLSDISKIVKQAIISTKPSQEIEEEASFIVPASEEELKILSQLEFDDENDEY